jgi:hypothetical protein
MVKIGIFQRMDTGQTQEWQKQRYRSTIPHGLVRLDVTKRVVLLSLVLLVEKNEGSRTGIQESVDFLYRMLSILVWIGLKAGAMQASLITSFHFIDFADIGIYRIEQNYSGIDEWIHSTHRLTTDIDI